MNNELPIVRNRMTMTTQMRCFLWLEKNKALVPTLTLTDLTGRINTEAYPESPLCEKNVKTLLKTAGYTCLEKDPAVARQRMYDKMLALQGMIERQDEVIARLSKQVKELSGAVDLLSDTWAPTINCHAN
jgi:hypothetical protein